MKKMLVTLTILLLLLSSSPALVISSNAEMNERSENESNASSIAKIEAAYNAGKIDYETTLLYKVYAIFNKEKLPGQYKSNVNQYVKSGTPIILEVKKDWADLSPETQGQLDWIFLRPTDAFGGIDGQHHLLPQLYGTQHFVIHWTNGTDGGNAVDAPNLTDSDSDGTPDYIENFAVYFETCYTTEVTTMRYNAPPNDLNEPNDGNDRNPDGRYDVFVYNLGTGLYGYTDPEQFPNTPSCSYIGVNNNYGWAPPNQDPDGTAIGAMKVTAAHEFFHAIQFDYDVTEERWWMETTAVWMEDEVYDVVNDYLNYLPAWFANPDVSLTTFDGQHEYGNVIFAKFLSEMEGIGIIRDIWIEMITNNGTNAIDSVLTHTYNTDLRTVFGSFTVTNYLNGLNNHNGDFNDDAYEEGDHYDDVTILPPNHRIIYTGAVESRSDNVNPWATDYMEIVPTTDDPLKIHFDGDNASDFMVQTILIDGGTVYGMNTLELNTAQDGDYWIYSANEYDNIILVIARGENVGTGDYTATLSPEYGYWAPPFKFSDVIDDGDSPWDENYHVQLRISTNPLLDQLGGEGGMLLGGDSGDASSSLIENPSPQVQTSEAENWVEVGRGRDHSRYWNELTDEYKQVIYSGPIHTWDGSRWMSYVFENKNDYYQVQHPIASARFYPERTELWDENFSDRVVSSEDWSVERLENGNWHEIDFNGSTISYDILSEDELKIIRSASSPRGTLRTTYIFRRGSPLKIMLEFTASENMSVRFAWRPEVEGAASHQVRRARLRDLNPTRYWGSAEGEDERDVGVSFFDGSAEPVANFVWWEEAGNENLLIGVDATHENLLVRFGDFGLGTGQSAVLDPTVKIGPDDDATIVELMPNNNYGNNVELWVAGCGVGGELVEEQRSFLKFSLSTLESGASIESSALHLCVLPLDSNGGWVEVREVDDDGWLESTITWNNRPTIGDFLDNTFIEPYPDVATWYEWDVTSFVGEQRAVDNIVSLCMKIAYDGEYAWDSRFSSKEGDNAPYLAVTYVIDTLPPPPKLLSPDDGSTIYTLTPRLDWKDVAGYGVDRYRIRVKKGTIPVVKDEVSSSNGNNSKYDVYENLSWGETYKWRVKAHNSVGWGNWSSWWEFTTEIPPVENAWVYWRYGSSDIDDTQYDGSMGMEGPVGATSGVWSAALPWPGPDRRWQMIYWRVKARAVGGEENWSPVYVGGVITNPPDAPLDIMALQYEPDEPYSIQLKFARPSTYGTVRARLYLCANQVGEGWGSDGFVMRVDNQTWDESITEDEFDNQEVAENENFEGKWTSVGWDWVDVTNQLKAETGAHLTLRLSWRYYEEWETGNIIDNNTLMLGTREYDDYVTFYSTEALENWAWLEVIPPEVATSIWTSDNYGRPGENITFEITVKNNWVENDSFNLTVEDTTGWGLTLTDNLLENVAPSENRTVILSVAVPENAEPDTGDEITVTATSWADSTVSDSASCIAHAISENTFTLDLVAGMNLVGFTAVGENDTPNNLFLGLEYYTDYYLTYYEAPGGPYRTQDPDQVLEDNLGYWAWINQDRTVKTNGARPDNREIHLENGWNIVSFPVVNENTTPNNIFTGLEYYTDYYLYYWTAPGGPYGIQYPNQVLEDNLGYWVWIDQDWTVTVP